MIPILEIVQTLQTSRYNRSIKIPPQNTIFLQLLPCLAQHPSAFKLRCRTDKEGRGTLEPPPADFYVLHSFKPCRRQAKQTNAQALQTSSKTSAREYATAKLKTLATTVWEWCQVWKSSRRCRRQDTAKVPRLPSQNTIFLQLLACLAQHPSAFTSRCGTGTAGRGAFEPPLEDGARTKLFGRGFQFRESHTEDETKKTPDRIPEKKSDQKYIFILQQNTKCVPQQNTINSNVTGTIRTSPHDRKYQNCHEECSSSYNIIAVNNITNRSTL